MWSDPEYSTPGNVYIADRNNQRVEKVTPAGTLPVFAGTGTAGPPTPGPATSSNLATPSGVAVEASGNVYIADTGNHHLVVAQVAIGSDTYMIPDGDVWRASRSHIAWLKQWYDEPNADPSLDRPGSQVEALVDTELRSLGLTHDGLSAWRRPAATMGRPRKAAI